MLDSAVQALRLDQIQASDEPVRILGWAVVVVSLARNLCECPANTQVWATDLAVVCFIERDGRWKTNLSWLKLDYSWQI